MGEEADWLWDCAMAAEANREPDRGYEFPGLQVHETEKAVLWHREGDLEAVWLPKSHIMSQDTDTIRITTWLTWKKGWLEDDDEIEFP